MASDASEKSTSDAPEIRKFGFSDFRESGFSVIWNARKSGNPDVRISEHPDFRKVGKIPNPDSQIFQCFGFSGNRKNQKSGKKASDVEFAYVEFPLRNMVIDQADCKERGS